MWARELARELRCGGPGGIRTPMPFGPGLQPGEPPLLNRPTDDDPRPRLRTRGGPGTDVVAGADDGTRTRNLRFTKPLLYQLSYVGTTGRAIPQMTLFRRRGMIGPPDRVGQACASRPTLPGHDVGFAAAL